VEVKILYCPNEYSQQRQFERPANIYPILMAMECEYYRKQGHHVAWRTDKTLTGHDYVWYDKVIREPEGIYFLDLPKPDRIFTHAMDYAYDNGNFKYTPGTYIQAASGCWWGKCSFCVEKDKPYIVREVDDVIEEINECKSLGYREIFDDSGTFPIGGWLDEFCDKVSKVGIRWSCNMRLIDLDYKRLRSAGCRMLLFGLESASPKTNILIQKGVKVEDIKYIKKASEAGLDPHIACMFGYPWETDKDSIRTLRLVHYLLKKGYAKTAQASFYCGKDEQGNESQRKYVKRIYDVWRSPAFWLNKLHDIKDTDDIKYLWRAIKKGIMRD